MTPRPVWLFFLLLFPFASSSAQESASVSGFVTDAASGETLILANVRIEGTSLGAASNNAGFYSLAAVPAGEHVVAVSFVGYETERVEVRLAAGEARRLDVALEPASFEGGEVVVTAERSDAEAARDIGVTQLNIAQVAELPSILEPDVFRALQLMPGVKASSDFSSGLYVRGGSPDQTLILLDRTTVYNASHFFGFFSTFNPDAIKDVRLYKGVYPAEYGGRLGSVVDIYNKDGNRVKTQGTATIGLLASRALLEGPYSRGSWMVAFRRSTIDPLLSALRAADVESIPDLFYFYDANAKLNFDASRNDRFSVTGYAGTDRLDITFLGDARAEIGVGNQTFSANWTHLFDDNLFSNFTLTSSHYYSNPRFTFSGTTFSRENHVYDQSARGEFEYVPRQAMSWKTGFWFGQFRMRINDSFDGQQSLDEGMTSLYGSAYIENTYEPGPGWTVRTGLRGAYFRSGSFVRLEPRLSLEYEPRSNLRLQAGYGRYNQFLTLITSELFSAFDIWLTSAEDVAPSFGDQFALGAKTSVARDVLLDLEVYYRTMRSLFEIDPFLVDPSGRSYAELFRHGRGNAYGLEAQLQKTRGRLYGSIAYTLSRTRRAFPNVNEGRLYAPKYDRTHDLTIVSGYRLGRGWRATAVFNYGTGQPYTNPSQQFRLVDSPFASSQQAALISQFNGSRLPPYHRLDVGFERSGGFFGIGEYELQLQMINVYGRRNLWFVFYDFMDEGTTERQEVSQIPVPVPNIALTVNF